MVELPTSKGGGKVTLNPQQFRQFQEVVSKVSNPAKVALRGDDPDVKRAAAFAIGERRRRGAIVAFESFQSSKRALSQFLQSTPEGVVDTRTGKVVAPLSASATEAGIAAAKEFAKQQAIQPAQEKQRIEDQLKRSEQGKIIEQQRQEKIRSGAIVGQIESSGPTPLQAGPVKDTLTRAEQIGTGFGGFKQRPTSEFIRKDIIAPIFGGVGDNPETILTSFRNVGKLFTDPSKKKGDIQIQTPLFGTAQDTQGPFGAGGGGTTTEFQLLRETAIADPELVLGPEVKAQQISGEISKSLTQELQPKVSSGDLTIEQAEKEFETRFEEEATKRQPEFEKFEGFQSRIERGEKPSKDFGTAAELVGIAAASTTPVGAAVVGSAFVAEGIPKLGKGVGGSDLTFKERSKEIGLGLVDVGFGLTLGGGAVIRAGRLASAAEIEGATQRALLNQKGFRFKEGDLTFDISRGSAKGEAIADIQEIQVSRVVDGKVVSEGKRVTSVLGQDIFSGKQFGRIITEDLTGPSTALGQIEGVSFVLGRGARIKTSELSIKETRKGFVGDLKTFEFDPLKIERDISVGFGKQDGQIIRSGGGKLRKAQLETIQAQNFEFATDVRLDFPLETRTILRQITIPSKDSGITILKGSRGGKPSKPFDFSPTPQVVKTETFVPKVSFQAPKIDIVKPSGPEVGVQRALGGGGLTELQIREAQGRGGFEIGGGLVPPGTRDGFAQPTLVTPKPTGGLVGLDFKSDLKSDVFIPTRIDFERRTPTRARATPGKTIPRIDTKAFTDIKVDAKPDLRIQTRSELKFKEPLLEPPPRTTFRPTPFDPFGDFSFRPFGFGVPKLLGGTGTRGKPKRRSRARVAIRPSFTGIVLGIEAPAIVSPTLGVTPGQIRGLATGFDVPKKKKKSKKKK